MQYDLRLRKPFPWAWLLLLLLPLLLIPFERDITVHTLGLEGEDVPGCSVEMKYTQYALLKEGEFLYVKEHNVSAVTDSAALATFSGVRVSVFSWLFHHFESARFLARKGRRTGENSFPIHSRQTEPLPIVLENGSFEVEVRSRSYDMPIRGAEVEVELSDRPDRVRAVTDSSGRVLIPGVKPDVIARSVTASREGYKPSEKEDVRVGDYDERPLVLSLDIVLESVDIVMCIDATASMDRPLSVVKKNALTFHRELQARCGKYGKTINGMRLKVILFRDFAADGKYALQQSDFFEIPSMETDFESFIRGIAVSGGGDTPENALEAVASAMNSKWRTGAGIRRQIVVVWTDAPAHPIGKVGLTNPVYPKGIPTSFEDLTSQWESGAYGDDGSMKKRIVLFTPSSTPWDEIMSTWTGVYHEAEVKGVSITSYDFERIVDRIAQNI